jgi:RNA polymerase sigma-70 factor (ECF subfamily)
MKDRIRKAQRNDKEAFSELMRQSEKSMYRIARAILKNDEDAADAMQETILLCWKKMNHLKNPDHFNTWLTRILINEAKKIAKKRTKILLLTEQLEPIKEERRFSEVEWEEMLYTLSEKYRIVVILYYIEGYKVREISQILDITESATKARLKTAREQLERQYQGVERI